MATAVLYSNSLDPKEFLNGTYNRILLCSLMATAVLYSNSLDPDEMLNNSSHPGPSCLTLNQHFWNKNVPF